MRDAIELEWAGVPAVAIVHETLSGSAHAICSLSQMVDYPFIEVGLPALPTSRWPPEHLAHVMDTIFDDVVRRLVATGGD